MQAAAGGGAQRQRARPTHAVTRCLTLVSGPAAPSQRCADRLLVQPCVCGACGTAAAASRVFKVGRAASLTRTVSLGEPGAPSFAALPLSACLWPWPQGAEGALSVVACAAAGAPLASSCRL